MARELASWLLETRVEGEEKVRLVQSTDKALTIGRRMVRELDVVACARGD